jgi:hypothetical protein
MIMTTAPTAIRSTLQGQLDAVKELVHALETQTTAGQRHSMAKVVGFLDAELRRRFPAVVAEAEGVVGRWLAELARECERRAPDIDPWIRRAEILLDTLGAA